MTRLESYLRMTAIYGTCHPVVKQFTQLMKNPDVKDRHLQTIVECHEKKHEEILKNA